MPNWITNKIKSAPHVIQGMLNTDGLIDFSVWAPFPGEHGKGWQGINLDAQTAAEAVLNVPLNSHPLIASLESVNRQKVDLSKLSDESFEQFIGMLRNHRKCGYLHTMDFSRDVWGTKWNACEQQHDINEGAAVFETAWSCPKGALLKLSERFPGERIDVAFADEDIGSNCGTFTLLSGKVIDSDVAPTWKTMTDEQKERWKKFACDIKGYDLADYQD